MHHSEFRADYLPSAMPTPSGHIDLLGIAPLDGTHQDLYLPADYHKEGTGSLRLTHAQARHVVRILTHALSATEERPHP